MPKQQTPFEPLIWAKIVLMDTYIRNWLVFVVCKHVFVLKVRKVLLVCLCDSENTTSAIRSVTADRANIRIWPSSPAWLRVPPKWPGFPCSLWGRTHFHHLNLIFFLSLWLQARIEINKSGFTLNSVFSTTVYRCRHCTSVPHCIHSFWQLGIGPPTDLQSGRPSARRLPKSPTTRPDSKSRASFDEFIIKTVIKVTFNLTF